IRAAVDAQPAVLSTAWPRDNQDLAAIFGMAHERGIRVLHMVPTANDAIQAAQAGADVIIAQGTDAGGHIGLIGTVVIAPQVRRRREELLADMFEARKQGNVQESILYWGQGAGLISEIVPAARVIADMVTEAETIIAERLPGLVVREAPTR